MIDKLKALADFAMLCFGKSKESMMLPTEIGEEYSVCKRRGILLIVASNRESIVHSEKAGLLAYSNVYHPSHPFLTGQWILYW